MIQICFERWTSQAAICSVLRSCEAIARARSRNSPRAASITYPSRSNQAAIAYIAVRLFPSTNPWSKTRLSARAAARLNGESYGFFPPNGAGVPAMADSRKLRSQMQREPPNSVTATVCIQTSSSRLTRGSTGSLSEVAKLG